MIVPPRMWDWTFARRAAAHFQGSSCLLNRRDRECFVNQAACIFWSPVCFDVWYSWSDVQKFPFTHCRNILSSCYLCDGIIEMADLIWLCPLKSFKIMLYNEIYRWYKPYILCHSWVVIFLLSFSIVWEFCLWQEGIKFHAFRIIKSYCHIHNKSEVNGQEGFNFRNRRVYSLCLKMTPCRH